MIGAFHDRDAVPVSGEAGEENLAWSLVDFAAAELDRPARFELYSILGAGDHANAIESALHLLAPSHRELPRNMGGHIHRWLDGYVGNPIEPRLRRLLRSRNNAQAS